MRQPRGGWLSTVLGLDLGTSQVKALLVATDGTVLGYQVASVKSRHEQD